MTDTTDSKHTGFSLGSSPHIFSHTDMKETMRGTAIAFLPVIGASIYFFRLHAAVLITTCIITCIFTEALCQLARRRPVTVDDWSAVVTGCSLALILPPTLPLSAAIIGSVFAIVVGKQIFGGLGHNIFNPSLLARAFLMANYPRWLTTWVEPLKPDAVSSATPLALAKFQHEFAALKDLFFGNVSGSLGETSAFCVLLGGIYLFYKKYGDWRIPGSILSTVFVYSGILWVINPACPSPIFHLLAGGLMYGAVFQASDPVTSPVSAKGKIIFGIGIGLILVTIRIWGGLTEGVMYAILFMNALTPLIDRITIPRRFGARQSPT
ncbi:MAG: RnfABCDGE type electron transport complex subunit D [Candidatus Omnitrophica bacterium]|nr:RnfABCDGE type electron transport complex subunit D [Candidatus Omnitrophota bacterium]